MKKIFQKVVAKKEKTEAEKQRDERQLRRLQTLMDVIFGVLIIRIFTLLPQPGEVLKGNRDPLTIFGEGQFVMFVIGIILVSIYWFQSNKTNGNLVATDGKHSFISILQMLFLLLYFYSVGLDAATHSDVLALFMQSVTLALAGFAGVAAWVYASKHAELLSEAVSEEEVVVIRHSILTEPLAALFTIPFAFISPLWWNIAWLSVLFFGWVLKRRQK
jgi:uncharacterized membrane protein